MSNNIILNFGKYKNKPIEEVDEKYLRWLYNQNKDKHQSPYIKDIIQWIEKNTSNEEKQSFSSNETLKFGKYKDMKLEDIPKNYILWLINNNKDNEKYKAYNKILESYL